MNRTRPLDAASFQTDLSHIVEVVAKSLDPSQLQVALGEIRSGLKRPLLDRSLIRLAVLADCLRLVYTTLSADGRVSDQEIDAALPLLEMVRRTYGRELRGYHHLGELDGPTARSLLATYGEDSEAFGFRHDTTEWSGLDLCRRTALAGDPEALTGYEQMALRLFDHLAAVDGLSADEASSRRSLQLLLAEKAAVESPSDHDHRQAAFLSRQVEVFSSVAHAHMMHERDPLDVEEVHTEARAAFDSIVDRATDRQTQDKGRLLLILGESGSGKTHLLRALRGALHSRRHGYAAYIQLHSRNEDYARYVNSALVDALDQPYDAPDDMRSGLLSLSDSLAELLRPVAGALVDELRSDVEGPDGDEPALTTVVDSLVDELLSIPDFESFDPDLLRAILFLQRRDPRITPRALKYLRCERMNDRDRGYLGDVMPRTDPDDPMRMIVQLGKLAWTAQGRAFALLLDQVEDQSYGDDGYQSFLRAVDTLRRITDELPSAVGIIACLEDLYRVVEQHLVRSARDRLENDPPLQRLSSARSFDEIRAVVERRLEYLYDMAGARFQPDSPLFPIPVEALRRYDNRRLRDVLDFCHTFHERCIVEQRIVDDVDLGVVTDSTTTSTNEAWHDLDLSWNDVRSGELELPLNDGPIIDVLRTAVDFVALELAATVPVERRDEGELFEVTIGTSHLMVVGLANKGHQGGGFARQVEAVRLAAGPRTAVVARTSEFPAGPKSRTTIVELRRAGGRNHVLHDSDLRAVVAMGTFLQIHGRTAVVEWLTDRRPISSLSSIAMLLDLDQLLLQPAQPLTPTPGAAAAAAAGPAAEPVTGPVTDADVDPGHGTEPGRGQGDVAAAGSEPGRSATPRAPATTPASAPAPREPAPVAEALPIPLDRPLQLGRADSLGGGACELAPSQLKRHSVVLGATGSGKTTAALTIIEQLLERDVPAVLVDRKGDLSGYARDAWWDEPGPSATATARKRALRERIDIRLFTPGAAGGRPLGLAAVPELAGLPDHEQSTLVKYTSAALAELAGFPRNTALQSILIVAVRLLSQSREHTDLEQLIEFIDSRDSALVAEVARFDDKHFKKLVELLDGLRISNDDLFDSRGDQLSASVLLEPGPSGRIPLTIVNTQFLGDNTRLQLWTSRLIGELYRFAARSPSDDLQAIVMFDEADIYLPAGTAKPTTKEPMFDLLRRGRSGGVGVILATQSPGDFDYRTSDVVTSWLVGKVASERSINKMRPLFESQRAAVGSKLGKLGPGQFFLLGEGNHQAIRVSRSLLDTEQLATADIIRLAAGSRGRVSPG